MNPGLNSITSVLPRLALLLSLITMLVSCGIQNDSKSEKVELMQQIAFTGREVCIECHQKEYGLFLGSDHDKAMDLPTPETVLGDFEDASFIIHGIESKFYKKGDDYYVLTEGQNGEMQEFKIAYTFGHYPLQQYLIEFDKGRIQCLPICWDSRSEEEGGQNWFHVYGEEHIKATDVLFWTRNSQNYNYMCSECHSTNVRKKYNYKTNTYQTSWNEIDVSCEACHGPGEKHEEWANLHEAGMNTDAYTNMGLVIRLKDLSNGSWVFKEGQSTASRTVPSSNPDYFETCGRCHSRRSIIDEDYKHGQHLLQTHRPSLLEDPLYFHDGQIHDEVYVYASFLQSKMHTAGVQCVDCHDVHSTELYAQGNALCYRCHLADTYGVESHHHHPIDSKGALCVECHMPERTYMQVDPRRDHSIRIPRPDIAQYISAPDACTNCHQDEGKDWVVKHFLRDYKAKLSDKKHYGVVFYEASRNYPGSWKELIYLINDNDINPIIKASALLHLQNFPVSAASEQILLCLQDSNSLIRYAAVQASEMLPTEDKLSSIRPLLHDSVKLIRILASQILSEIPEIASDSVFITAYNEFLQSQIINADQSGNLMNIAIMHVRKNQPDSAEYYYKLAILREENSVFAYVNLADLYRQQNREDEGKQLLLNAIKLQPDYPDAYYALGLLYVREKENEKAMDYFKSAWELSNEAYHAYIYAIALNSSGQKNKALEVLEEALIEHKYNENVLYTLTNLYFESKDYSNAKTHCETLLTMYPNNQQIIELYQFLQQQNL